eukprot:3547494-Amphidinium_carterae.1
MPPHGKAHNRQALHTTARLATCDVVARLAEQVGQLRTLTIVKLASRIVRMGAKREQDWQSKLGNSAP